jgi:hypothetical protein
MCGSISAKTAWTAEGRDQKRWPAADPLIVRSYSGHAEAIHDAGHTKGSSREDAAGGSSSLRSLVSAVRASTSVTAHAPRLEPTLHEDSCLAVVGPAHRLAHKL